MTLHNPNWKMSAKGMLENERRMKPFHKPPSTGVLVRWRGQVKVGMVQWPVDSKFPAIVFLSITSVDVDPEYIKAVRALDPGRLELQADAALDLTVGNFHVLHRVGVRLTKMTPEETFAMQEADLGVVSITPTAKGIHFDALFDFTRKKK